MTHHSAFGVTFGSLDVMVVDDSEPMLKLYRTCLVSFGISSPRTFTSAKAAFEEIRLMPPDLLIADWRMGPPNGHDLLRRLRCSDMAPACLTAVIVVTGHASETYVKSAMLAGAQQFIVKPVSPRTLFERIDWVTEDDRELLPVRGRYVIEGVAERVKWYERSVAADLSDYPSRAPELVEV